MDTALTLLSHTVEMNRYADAPIGIPADSSGIYNELIAKVSRENKEMDIVIRLYDDGVAIRYWLRGYENVILEGDMTEINLTNDGTAYWSVGDYNSGEKLNYYRGATKNGGNCNVAQRAPGRLRETGRRGRPA